MKQRIFWHFQDYLIQYISHQYQDLLYCNSSQYILSTYNSHYNNNNNVVLAMTMTYSGQGWRVVHYVFNPDHYIAIVIANTTLLYNYNGNMNSKSVIYTLNIPLNVLLMTTINRSSVSYFLEWWRKGIIKFHDLWQT
jgi:hypothetical protein